MNFLAILLVSVIAGVLMVDISNTFHIQFKPWLFIYLVGYTQGFIVQSLWSK